MARSPLPPPVKLLGWASLFTDAATEMIYPLLPIYLSRVLGASALSLGVIEGVAEGINSLLKAGSGYVSDRQRRRRPIVIAGYALSSLARPFIALTMTWTQVLAIRVIDRTGKGIRGAPRDAMLAQFATAETRGRVFGFHRAMDHTGAIIGPIIATAILFFAPDQYRLVFALTIIPGAIAVALLFRVPEPQLQPQPRASAMRSRTTGRWADPSSPPGERTTVRRADPLGPPDEPEELAAHVRLPKRLFAFFAVLLVFSLGNSADAFLLLRLSDMLGSATYIPLIWSALHVVKASLSTWGGSLSDRIGRKRVIIIGWSVYAAVYVGFATATGPVTLIAWFLAYGAFFALTEGAEKALVADLAPVSRQGTAFGLYNAALGVGSLLASIAFGLIYERVGAAAAFGTGAALAALAVVMLVFVRTSSDSR